MRNHNKQSGFALVEVSLIVVILCIIAFVAWRVIEANGTVQTTQIPQSTVISDTNVPPASSTSDLDNLDLQMSEANVDDESGLTELDAQTAF